MKLIRWYGAWRWIWEYGFLFIGLNAGISRRSLRPDALVIEIGLGIGGYGLEIEYL